MSLTLALVPPAQAQTETSSVSPGDDTAATRRDLTAQRAELDAQRAELEALAQRLHRMEEAQLTAPSASADPSAASLAFYGFFETGLQRTWVQNNGFFAGIQQSPAWTFIVGSVNLYLDARPAPGWRALFELRLTTSHGSLAEGAGGLLLLNTTERRINEPGFGTGGTQLRSSLIMERAQIEYEFDDWLGARIGLWLTPWGIWNVDHGSPTLIPLFTPYFVAIQTFPTHQMGLALFGRARLSRWQIAYQLAFSNGRVTGPSARNDAQWPSFDITDDKMVSGRLELSRGGRAPLRLGASAYWGRTAQDAREIKQINPIRIQQKIGVELEEFGVGGDVSWDPWRLRVRAEFLYNVFRYPGVRPLSTLYPTELEADSAQYAGYLLISAPVELFEITVEPYVYSELLWQPSSFAPLDLGGMVSFGLNLDLTTSVRIKTQYGFQFFFEDRAGSIEYSSTDRMHVVATRVVVSF